MCRHVRFISVTSEIISCYTGRGEFTVVLEFSGHLVFKTIEVCCSNKSVVPFDVLVRARATLKISVRIVYINFSSSVKHKEISS